MVNIASVGRLPRNHQRPSLNKSLRGVVTAFHQSRRPAALNWRVRSPAMLETKFLKEFGPTPCLVGCRKPLVWVNQNQ